ncbi:unnamed protein product, partial [Mesorhabditis spiculigera]
MPFRDSAVQICCHSHEALCGPGSQVEVKGALAKDCSRERCSSGPTIPIICPQGGPPLGVDEAYLMCPEAGAPCPKAGHTCQETNIGDFYCCPVDEWEVEELTTTSTTPVFTFPTIPSPRPTTQAAWLALLTMMPRATGEKLCTIAEESLESARDLARQEKLAEAHPPKKSATFGTSADLRRHTAYHLYRSKSGKNLKTEQPRKRSLLVEMGSRLKLFPTGSVLSLSHNSLPAIPKAQSLNSFENVSCASSRIPSTGGGKRSQRVRVSPRGVGSIVSLDQVECGVPGTSPSQLGMLCSHCSTQDIPCAKAIQVQQIQVTMAANLELVTRSTSVSISMSLADDNYDRSTISSTSLASSSSTAQNACSEEPLESGTRSCSLLSLSPSSSPSAPLCRICHCAYPIDPLDPLISPCRCSGSLQHVHVSCLMHWLDISSRKLHRPAICELCLYKYRRRRVLKYRELQMPECPGSDIRYYLLLLFALIMIWKREGR